MKVYTNKRQLLPEPGRVTTRGGTERASKGASEAKERWKLWSWGKLAPGPIPLSFSLFSLYLSLFTCALGDGPCLLWYITRGNAACRYGSPAKAGRPETAWEETIVPSVEERVTGIVCENL